MQLFAHRSADHLRGAGTPLRRRVQAATSSSHGAPPGRFRRPTPTRSRQGVPILYAPYLSFPLSDARKSGILTPEIGSTGRSGNELSIPYYWNIAENYDATFTSHWFSARGYVMKRAPESAQPIRLLMTHREQRGRSYAFFFDRGRLHAQRAGELLEKARSLGIGRLLVAAEHGADATVSAGRLSDVLVLDWVSLDREIRKLDFGIAAKLVAIARTRRGVLGLA